MSAQREVLIVPTAVANIASVAAALRRAGAWPRLARDAKHIRDAPAVVLPGVGAFGPAMQQLEQAGMVDAIRDRITARVPTLAICVGMQLLCRESEESPGVAGLGIIDATVERFRNAPRVPQMGWNLISPCAGCELLEEGHGYFANSFRIDEAPPGWTCATTDHGDRFVSAMESEGVLACQFHPELSGRWGHRLLARWLARCFAGTLTNRGEPAC